MSRSWTVLTLPPLNAAHITVFILIYPAFVAISLLPVFVEATLRLFGSSFYRDELEEPEWPDALWHGGHTIYISPIITFLGVLSLFAQVAEMTFGTSDLALSADGLGYQAVLFGVLGLSWTFRLRVAWLPWENSWKAFGSWYQLVEWAAVDDLVFGAVQGGLFLVVWAWEGRGSVT